MKKSVFFWVILIQFVISFFVTVLGIIGWVTISEGRLTVLVSVLVVEQAAAIIALFKNTDFFGSEPTNEAWDLLATLWKYQKQDFGDDKTKKWFLSILPQTPDFADFCLGFSTLYHLRLIHVGHGFQTALTDKGYQFCEQNKEKLKKRKRHFYIS